MIPRRCILRTTHRALLPVLLLAAPGLFSQIIHIDCGSATDQYFTGGTACSAGQPAAAPCMPAGTIPPTLRYGAKFDYNLPADAGKKYLVRLTMMDPNSTAAGQRLFTVAVNGRSSAPLDLFALAGNYPYQMLLPATLAPGASTINIHFQASIKNAIATTIEMFDGVMGFTTPGPITLWAPPNSAPIPFWQPAAFISQAVGERLVGATDGANTTFTFPGAAGLAAIYRNGVRLTPFRDYSVSGQTVTMTDAPQPGDVLLADYQVVR